MKNLFMFILVISALAGAIIFFAHKTNKEITFYESDEDAAVFFEWYNCSIEIPAIESRIIIIPREMTPVYENYNHLQLCSGFDISKYLGKTVIKKTYKVNGSENEFASILVYKNKIIAADIHSNSIDGGMRPVSEQPDNTD